MINRALTIAAVGVFMGLALIKGLGCGWAKQQGSGVAFVPTDIAGLKVWLKADSLSLNDNDAVTTWTDSSGTGNDVTQGTAARRPTYKTNILNGKPIVRFGGAHQLQAASRVFDRSKKYSIYVVAKPASVHDGALVSTVNAIDGDTLRFRNNGALELRWYKPSYDVAGLSAGSFAQLTAIVRATTGANGTITLRKNGSELGTSASGARSTADEGDFSVGSHPNFASTHFNGDYAELLLYEGDHDATQISNVEAYLVSSSRWGAM